MQGHRFFVFIALALSMLFTMGNQGCDVSTPEQVEKSTREALAPYFPNVRVFAYPQHSQVSALTCTTGTGPQLIEEITQALSQDPSLGKFNQLRTFSAITGGRSYNSFFIGFEHDVIVYQVDERHLFHKHADTPGYEDWYQKKCFGDDANAAVHASPLAR